jgi:alpha-beta hydrolase superfamily lysophospholipase
MYPVIGKPRLTGEAFFSEDMPDEQVAEYFSRMQDESYRAYLDMIMLNLPCPKKVRTPVLVLGAADDRLITAGAIEATARAYGTQAEIFSVMAHDMMLERGWQAVADRIIQWLSEQGLE